MNESRVDAVLAGLGKKDAASVFGPVVTKTASSLLAERIRAAILDGRLSEGTVMPTERELAEQTGLGRSTVREALRLLQAAGLVTSRPGAKGGSVVQLPHVDDVVQSLDVFIRGRGLSFASLLETREALEPMCARLAARARTDEDVRNLQALHERMSAKRIRQADFSAANADWHLAIAQASHNELLSAFMSAIGQAIELGITRSSRKSAEVRPQVLHAHGRILDAIRDGDPDAAMRRMLSHVHAYTEQVADWRLPDDLPLDGD